jgi:ankyrin repeat protein
VEENRAAAIPLLLAYNSDLFAADNAGITPIELALRDNLPVLNTMITDKTVLQSDSAGNTPLMIGTKVNANPAIIGLMLDKKAVVNARNQEGDTALHIAVRQDEKEIGELLLTRSSDIFAPNARGETPLSLAFSSTGKARNNPGKLREWMFNGTTVQARDGGGNTALHYAALWSVQGKLDPYIPFIIQQGADPNAPNAIREPPLFMAVRVNSPSTILALIAQGAVIDNRDSQGNSSLHAAVRWNAPNAAETLIAQGAAINAHSLNGKTPLHDAVRTAQADMETLLIRNGASLEARDNEGNTPFMEAVIAYYPAAVQRLAELGSDPNTRNSRGDTPLHSAVDRNRIDLVSLLLGWGAQIHAKNIMGRSPFQAALAISPQMVSTLLTKDRIPASDDDGRSPLHIALLDNSPASILKTIIDLGGRVQAVDADGRTPLRLAVDMDKWEHAKLLTDANSNVFAMAGDGKTPADIVLGKGRDAVTALFSGKAITSRDVTGNTVLHYAAHTAGTEVISLLIELGANKAAKNISSESPVDVAVKWKRPSSITAMLN